jgi:ATP-dependent exoDNAse (exonuclease V) beta subunit
MDSILEFSTRNDEGISEFLKYWDEKGHKESVVVPDDTEALKVMTIHKAKGLQFPVVIYPFAKGKSKIGSDELWVDVDEEELPELKTALVKTSAKLEETVHADLRKKELEKSFLDALNVLYVAMTRPSKRMFVLMHNKLNAKDEWKIASPFADNADLFHDFLVHKNLWHNDQKTYIFGESEAHDKISKCEHDNLKDRNEVSLWPNLERCAWRDKITIGFKAPEAWDTETTDKNRDWGIVMHGILAAVKGVDDVDAAVDEAVIEGKIEVSVKDKVIGSLRQMINMPGIKPFFDPNRKVYVEKDIILKSGHSIRPDRIVMDGEAVWVIDYKTGEKEAKHRDQLNFYAAALEEMAYQNINKCLIYLHVDASKVEVVKW